jgi:hypothetical protein
MLEARASSIFLSLSCRFEKQRTRIIGHWLIALDSQAQLRLTNSPFGL